MSRRSKKKKMTIINDRKYLREVLRILQDKKIEVWLFGGWAEELQGWSSPRTHADVDLLYPAPDFRRIDSFIQNNTDWHEIVLKRFPHKRAAMFQGIMIEFTLIRKDEKGSFTHFFGRLRFDWPKDTFRCTVSPDGITVNAASRAALQEYRRTHAAIQEACRDYMAEQVTCSGGSTIASLISDDNQGMI